MDELALLKRKLEREKKARKAAEAILEERALQLYESNEKLRKLNNELELKVEERARQLIKSEEKYRRIIENMELGLLEVDTEQTIVKAYEWFCDMTGYRQAELIGRNAVEVLSPNQRHTKVIRQEQKNRERGQAGVYEIQIRHKQGHYIWVMISGCPVFDADGNITGSLGIHYDITRQKKLQEALLEAKKTAEKAQKAEQLFLAKMSHEIRTPLNAIIGMSHLLHATNPSEEQLEYLNILSDSSHILKLLISDILDFSKIQAGEITVQKSEFNLHLLISKLKNSVKSQIEGKDLRVTTSIDPELKNLILGDELLLNQILINLLGNARKFTKKGEINISVKVLQQTDKMLVLEFKVTDTGIGISRNKLELIFQNFKQVENDVQEQFGGTGLGLAITKQLVELQKGRIEVASKINKGSTFSVYLNYEKGGISPEETEIVPQPKLNPQFDKQKILVVEDNYMNRMYILTLLKKWNLIFQVAEDGLEAIEKTKLEKFDLIFMDISMPKLNGYETTRKIRNSSNPNQHTPIIALSASAFVTKKEKAMEMGMTDFLCKPFDPQSLFLLIDQYVSEAKDDGQQIDTTKEFKFPEPLNIQHLHKLYDQNWNMVYEMFKIFLKISWPSFKQFLPLVEAGNFMDTKKLAHKLAPNLSMVGLVETNQLVLQLEKLAMEGHDKAGMRLLLDQVLGDLELAVPAIEKTIEHLEKIFITTTQTI